MEEGVGRNRVLVRERCMRWFLASITWSNPHKVTQAIQQKQVEGKREQMGSSVGVHRLMAGGMYRVTWPGSAFTGDRLPLIHCRQ
jgi:hypothetical protein